MGTKGWLLKEEETDERAKVVYKAEPEKGPWGMGVDDEEEEEEGGVEGDEVGEGVGEGEGVVEVECWKRT